MSRKIDRLEHRMDQLEDEVQSLRLAMSNERLKTYQLVEKAMDTVPTEFAKRDAWKLRMKEVSWVTIAGWTGILLVLFAILDFLGKMADALKGVRIG